MMSCINAECGDALQWPAPEGPYGPDWSQEQAPQAPAHPQQQQDSQASKDDMRASLIQAVQQVSGRSSGTALGNGAGAGSSTGAGAEGVLGQGSGAGVAGVALAGGDASKGGATGGAGSVAALSVDVVLDQFLAKPEVPARWAKPHLFLKQPSNHGLCVLLAMPLQPQTTPLYHACTAVSTPNLHAHWYGRVQASSH